MSKLPKLILDEKIQVTEEIFRWEMNEDEMATEKLAQGIRLVRLH